MPYADLEARREYQRQYKLRQKELGKCRCGKDKLPGFARCSSCVASSQERTKERNARRRELGVCRHCGKDAGGASKCDSCREVARRHLAKLKADVISAYGGKCNCCGETEQSFLTIDHINNDGHKHRREVRTGRIYKWLARHDYPKDNFQLLCFNCNCGRHVNGGVCPHQIKSR